MRCRICGERMKLIEMYRTRPWGLATFLYECKGCKKALIVNGNDEIADQKGEDQNHE